MESSNQQPAATATTRAHRDMMFCHECHDEWYRDEHGLTCPECGSDFTEIIEEGHDPREDDMFGRHHGDDDDDESMPSLEEAPLGQHPLHHHNPFAPEDSPSDGGDRLQFRQVGPGRFAVTGTVYRTFSPSRQDGSDRGGNDGAHLMGGFASMLNSILGGGQGLQQGQGDQAEQRQGASSPRSASGAGTTPGGHRFHYTSNTRLFPRDPDNPGPRIEPVDDIHNILIGLMAAFDQPTGGQRQQQPHGHSDELPINPLLALLTGMMPGSGAAGDFVYSQEAMDRIVSQLMEQTQTSNAPGPASQQEIDALPRKHITIDMLGPEGRAECSICMDEVNIGEEVTELPCHHWFHHQCIAAWLGEHDTCPHCRKGISKSDNSGNPSSADSGATGATPTSQMPGSFVTGEGTSEHPFVVQEHQPGSGSAEEQGSSGGLGGRLRGLFGPPSR